MNILEKVNAEFEYRQSRVGIKIANMTIGVECQHCGHRWGVRTEDGWLRKGWFVCSKCGGHGTHEGKGIEDGREHETTN